MTGDICVMMSRQCNNAVSEARMNVVVGLETKKNCFHIVHFLLKRS